MKLKGLGVSGGTGSGTLVSWEEYMPTRSDKGSKVVILPELDGRVSGLAGVGGIVAFSGGVTSHGAVLARELGIPCVVLRDRTKVLEAVGRNVEVDGWEGQLEHLSGAPQ